MKCCKAVDFPLPSIIFLEQLYILGRWEKGLWGEGRVGFTSHAGVILSPVSQYTIQINLPKTDADDRTNENDADSLSRQKFNAPFWGNALQNKFRSIIWNGLFQKNKQTGGLRA